MSSELDILKPGIKKTFITSIVIGNMLEYMNFITFIFLMPIIASLFFPSQNHNLSITFTYLAIMITYIFRPIGGIILGNIGDKYGRKSVFSFTLLLMAIPSFIIGLLPTFDQIGYIAPIAMLLMRILQGCSMGGEVPGSVTYVVEKFHDKNYFFYCAILTCGSNLGIAFSGQIISWLTHFTSHHYMYQTGWRILFLLNSILALFGVYIRKFNTESEVFINIKKENQTNSLPFYTLIKNFKPEIIYGFLLCLTVSLTTSIFHVFLPGLLNIQSPSAILVATNSFPNVHSAAELSSFGAIMMAVFSLFFAYVTKYINPLRVIRFSELGLIILYLVILFYGGDIAHEEKNLYHVYGVILVNSILIAGINGLFFGLLADLFPVNVRYSGIATCYNLAYVFGAGLTPLWMKPLLIISENSYKYIIAVCLIFILIFVGMFKPKALETLSQ